MIDRCWAHTQEWDLREDFHRDLVGPNGKTRTSLQSIVQAPGKGSTSPSLSIQAAIYNGIMTSSIEDA